MANSTSPSPKQPAEARPAPSTLATISAVQEWIARMQEIPSRARSVEDQAYLVALRKRQHELRGARLASEEAKVREAQRKAETRRKIQLGGLVVKAGVDGWDEAALLGALLAMRDAAADPQHGPTYLAQWKARGGKMLLEENAAPADREPLVVTFPAPPIQDITRALRALKMRWSEAFQQWDGIANYAAVKAIADRAGGTVRRLNPPEDGSPRP